MQEIMRQFTRTRSAALLSRLITRLIPSRCPLCCQDCEHAVCDACQREYFATPQARCIQCAMPLSLPGDTRCGSCLQHGPAFDRTLVAVDYRAPVDRLVQALKYAGKLELAQCCAAALVPLLASAPALPDLLCPVPLSTGRLQERGYNQALEIARPVARRLRIALHARLLERVRETPPQARLPAPLRRDNVRNAFLLLPAAAAIVAGRHVGVVDDVMTTGATLDEIASTLKRFGASRVTNIVFARTPPH